MSANVIQLGSVLSLPDAIVQELEKILRKAYSEDRVSKRLSETLHYGYEVKSSGGKGESVWDDPSDTAAISPLNSQISRHFSRASKEFDAKISILGSHAPTAKSWGRRLVWHMTI